MLKKNETLYNMHAGIFTLPEAFARAPAVLAMGAELKSSFCLLETGQAQLFESNDDLEQPNVFRAYNDALQSACSTYAFSPNQIALDMHPDYLSTQIGIGLAERYESNTISVQHHHAHIAACLAEYAHPMHADPVLGIALDGLGFGADGTIWGGEFLLANYTGFTRLACFQPVAMPGGAQAIREPWRNTLAHLHACGWKSITNQFPNIDIMTFLHNKPLAVLETMLNKGLNSPTASSAGRLFDAVAACLDIHREMVNQEGQAAIALERIASQVIDKTTEAYPFNITACPDGLIQLQWQAMWQAILTDIDQGMDQSVIAARFHQTLITAVSELAMNLCQQHQIKRVVLSGGVFQNHLLRSGVERVLQRHGFKMMIAQQTPINDGGLPLGQAAIAAATCLSGAGHV
ncbi:MAG: hypothetical protein Q9M17_02915 [Mariprofundus sp.]|nr:hypothetical protein [Mariprofundus sp.]